MTSAHSRFRRDERSLPGLLHFVTPERISATLTGHAEIRGAIDAGDQAAAETLIRRRIETSRSEIREFKLRHMALAPPAPGQARGTAPRRSKARS